MKVRGRGEGEKRSGGKRREREWERDSNIKNMNIIQKKMHKCR